MRYLNRRVVVLVAHLRGRHSSQAKKIKPHLSSTDYILTRFIFSCQPKFTLIKKTKIILPACCKKKRFWVSLIEHCCVRYRQHQRLVFSECDKRHCGYLYTKGNNKIRNTKTDRNPIWATFCHCHSNRFSRWWENEIKYQIKAAVISTVCQGLNIL
jgi:hypothetical protein